MYEKEIENRLRELYESGKTYDEIAKITGVSKPVIAQHISGRRPIKNPSISLLLKVFPKAVISLEGAHNTSVADHGGVSAQDISVSGNGNNFFAKPQNEIISRITDAVMTLDLSPEAKVKVYQIIKDQSK